jgi:hypothetical protein
MADPRRGPGPAQATRSAGRAGRSRRVAEFKLELKSTTNLAEGVAHKVHRLWDRVKHPAYGLVDNASESPIRAWASIRSFKANALTIKKVQVGGATGFCSFGSGRLCHSRRAQAKTFGMETASCHDSRARTRGLHRRALFALFRLSRGGKAPTAVAADARDEIFQAKEQQMRMKQKGKTHTRATAARITRRRSHGSESSLSATRSSISARLPTHSGNLRFNPVIRNFYAQLRARRKYPKSVLAL